MVGLIFLLWALFLIDACFRVRPATWIVRPRLRCPVQQGGDFEIQGFGSIVCAPLLPWQPCYVTTGTTRSDGVDASALEREIAPMRCTSGLLGVLLLLVLPALAVRGALTAWWPWWLALTSLSLGATVWLYHRARRRWNLQATPHVWMLLLSPVSAVHAPHLITRYVFTDAAPARLFDATLTEPPLLKTFHRLWWDQEDQRDLILDTLTSRGLLGPWSAAPLPDGPGTSSYCPRCREQFRAGVERCPDCADVDLLPLPSPVCS